MSEQTQGESGWPAIRFIGAAVVLATLVCLAPAPNTGAVAAAASGLMLGSADANTIAFVGNSVVDHASKCDTDARSIPEMTGDFAKRPALDLSYGGQSFAESVNYAALALGKPAVTDVVVYVSLTQLSQDGYLDVRDQAFFGLVSGDLRVNDVRARLGVAPSVAATESSVDHAFTYKGVQYPDYPGLKARYFSVEKAGMGCPEARGKDRAFIEANYWNAYVRAPLRDSAIADLANLDARAKAAGKGLHVVLMPINFEDVAALDGHLAFQMGITTQNARTALAAAGLTFVDLTEILPATDFVDRWCACGHLGEGGRKAVAQRSAQTAS